MTGMTDRFAGRYALARELGRGSFGVVYFATDLELDRPVALKILHAALAVDPATVQLFKREAAILARLDHDNIIPVYDVGVSGDARYIVMKYVEGASLAQVLAREGAQPVARVMIWLEQMAAGLDYAHSRGVLHRDLKPGNLLLDAERNRVLITDFGLAHAVQNSGGSSSQQSQQKTSGTVGYLAPEVLQGEPATAASDRYSLGCVLYELLAGRPPFTGDNAMAIMFQHVNQPPPPLGLEGAAGQALEAQVMAMLAKQPTARPAAAQTVVQAVDDAQRAEESRIADLAETAGKGATQRTAPTQNRLVLPGAALVILLLACGLSILYAPGGIQFLPRGDGTPGIAVVIGGVTPTAVAQPEAALPANDFSILLGDIQLDFVHVPAGDFTMGSPEGMGDSDEHPQHTVYLDAYYIGATEVTNAQYARFVDAGGYANADYWSEAGWTWRSTNSIAAPYLWDDTTWNQPDQPVVGVTWYEAEAFTRWLSAASGVTVRLPTEAEWEKAACGTDGRVYPWGDVAPDATLANFNKNVGKMTAAGAYPAGASPYGALDMAGNVWEWTADWYDASYYATSPDQNPTGPSGGDLRVLRGGSWLWDKEYVRCASRRRLNPDFRYGYDGFRVVSPGS